MSSETTARQVLPTNVTPQHYELTLKPDLESFVFDGRVLVHLAVNQETTSITLNAFELDLITAEVTSLSTGSEELATIAYDQKRETVTLTLDEALPAKSAAVLDISFKGQLNDKMLGFYRSSYKDADGNTKYLATTQFEATYARRAFPCWDEPALKATFDVTLIVSTGVTALSNLNVIAEDSIVNTEDDSALREFKYDRTPIMSTYLLAFIAGPFDHIEGFTSGGIRTRIYALPSQIDQGKFALGVATKALDLFTDLFGIPFPLPKMDMVAIPDFAMGAMENWGLVTYRTVALLFDESTSSLQLKKRVAYVICHELAHQWFGNLVTMEWWDDLWLNEGFATWVGWFAVDKLFPEWDVWTSFVTEGMPQALTLDALRSSHPIEVTVNDASEIQQIFDAISYAKGASVIRMLSSWLGVDVFLAGVRRYLHRHKYQNAKTEDLWRALSEEADVDVGVFMQLWTKKVGYPVVDLVSVDSTTIELRQSRYLSTGDLAELEDETTWWIPLSIISSTSLTGDVVTLKDKANTFKLSSEAFKLNARQTGLYRVNYPIEILKVLAEEVKKGKDGILSHPTDRVGLLSDTGSLSVSGRQKTSGLLELLRSFDGEENYFVCSQISGLIESIASAWFEQHSEVQDALKTLRRRLFGPLAAKLGWESVLGEDYQTSLLRTLAISNAGIGGDPAIVTEAKRRFWKFARDGDAEALHPNLRNATFMIVLRNSDGDGIEEYDAILKVYQNPALPPDQNMLALEALGSVQSPELYKRSFELSLDEDKVRKQDSFYLYESLSSNATSRVAFWEWILANFDRIQSYYDAQSSTFSKIIKVTIQNIGSRQRIRETEEFFKERDTKGYQRSVEQGLEMALIKAQWVERDQEDVATWFRKEGYI